MWYSSGAPSGLSRPSGVVGSGHQVVKRGVTPWLMKKSSPSVVDAIASSTVEKPKGFAISTPIGLVVAGALAAASALDLGDERGDRVRRSLGWLQGSLTILVPVAFAVTVPAQALTGRLTAQTLGFAALLALGLALLARAVWQRGLRNYGGASA